MLQPVPSARGVRRGPGRLVALVGAIAAVSFVATAPAGAAPPRPAAPHAPGGIVGDQHSPTVALRAGAALQARDVYVYTDSPWALRSYTEAREAAADAVAVELALDPAAVREAWAAADLAHQTAVLAALEQLGVSYQTNTSSPGAGFDCSGLTTYAWARGGHDLVRQSSSQIDAAAPRDASTAMAGDLVQYPGHVMMYLGTGDAIVHAANHETDVALSTLRDGRSFRWGNPTG